MASPEIDRVNLAGIRFQVAVWEELLARRPDLVAAERRLGEVS